MCRCRWLDKFVSRGLCSCLSSFTAAAGRHRASCCEGRHPQSKRAPGCIDWGRGSTDRAAGVGGVVHHWCSDNWELPLKIQNTVVFFYFKKGIKMKNYAVFQAGNNTADTQVHHHSNFIYVKVWPHCFRCLLKM